VHTPSFPTSATVLKLIFGHTALTVTSTPSPLFSASPSSTQPSYVWLGERPSGTPAAPTVTPPAAVVVAAPAPPAAPAPTTPVAAASPVPAVVSTVIGLPPRGEATVSSCAAALAYLTAYAAPGFQLECPANAQGHEATTTCISEHTLCDLGRIIEIADPCPAAYMNEASNSWVLLGLSNAPIDPYGYCS
jgi:hypothetical protein